MATKTKRTATELNPQQAMLVKLAESVLDEADAERSQIHALSAEQCRLKHPRLSEHALGFSIPYYRLDGSNGFYRYRLIGKSLERSTGFGAVATENRKKQPKYLQEPDTLNEPYFSPLLKMSWLEVAKDVRITIIFTEGEIKAACGCKLLQLPVVGLGGVEMFRATKRGIEFLPELEQFVWKNRHVVICYDSDAADNPNVVLAENALGYELLVRGARPFVARIPLLDENKGKHEDPKKDKTGLDDFLLARGAEAFREVLEQAKKYDWRTSLMHSETGKIMGNLGNAQHALRIAPAFKGVLFWDEFAGKVTFRRPLPWSEKKDNWQDEHLNDYHPGRTAEWLQRKGINVGSQITYEALNNIAKEHPFHPVRDYLEGLMWDGEKRLDSWLSKYAGARDCKYARAVGKCWLISGVARVYQPGCKADYILALVGKQGIGKSTVFSTLAVKDEWFTDHISDIGSKDSRDELRGQWIVEWADFDETRGSVNRQKAYATTRRDKYRRAYGRAVEDHPRQNILGLSTNHPEFLVDETGNRRYWPVECGGLPDIKALTEDCDQLWAEALVCYRNGDKWWLEDATLIAAADERQAEHYKPGPWDEKIIEWLATGDYKDGKRLSTVTVPQVKGSTKVKGEPSESTRDRVFLEDIMSDCIGVELKDRKQADLNNVVRCLRHNKWVQGREGTGLRRWYYARPHSKDAASITRSKRSRGKARAARSKG
jgi:predicted P-loop ATPase